MEVMCYLSDSLKRYIEKFPYKNDITEIRLRSGKDVQFTVKGSAINIPDVRISQREIEDILFNMCHRSLNVYEDDISNGYITLAQGHRVGIAGEYFYSKQADKYLLKQVTSLNIRIAKDVKYFDNQDKLFLKRPESTLIIGPPHSGKTTLLKLYAKHLSQQYRVVVCDERNELLCGDISCDVIRGVKKADGISMATRTLNPEFIICDEIGHPQEAAEILSAVNTGVKFICSAHGESYERISKRPNIKILIDNDVFYRTAVVRQTNGSFAVQEVTDA